jgi:DNA-directed RNA polymerase specialized sigma24 family protein
MTAGFAFAFVTGRKVTARMDEDLSGDLSPALDEVYKTEIRRLIGLGSVLMGGRAAGEDLAHDAFLHVLRRTERDAGYLHAPAWPLLRTILVRLSIQRRRAIARESRRLARFWVPPDAAWWDPDPDLIDWQAALGVLPPRMRACVVLFYGEDLSVAGVASELQCSPRTVEHQLHAARTKLAGALGLAREDEGAS